jgi:hypothetical protein
MFSCVKVFGSVPVLRRIAAAYVPADHAKAKVNPLIAHFQAFFAALSVRFNVLDLIEMRAFIHGSPSPAFVFRS